jgi:hypothetical protein
VKKLWNWVKYSGAVINISVNPLYWKVLPWFKVDSDNAEWPLGPSEFTFSFGFLFLTVRIWIDDGRW